jgi:REP element-mobilizing transposase RayT
MVRRSRIAVEGGLYHVYNRVCSGEHIFADPEEAMEFIEIVRDVKKRDGWTIFAWCVMSNHIHVVLRTSTVPLWRGMHGIQNRFSRGFNRRHGRTGALWQSRYKAKYVPDQSYLDRLVLYVHLNPVIGGLVDDPEEYPFAGHREVKRRFRSPLVDVQDMLLCFGETQKVARRSYLRAMRIGVDPEAPEPEPTWHPFGVGEDAPLQVKADAIHVDLQGRTTDLERPRLEADEFINRVCELAGFEPRQLASRARDRGTANARKVVATLGVERWSQRRIALAAALNKNPDVVSFWAGEGGRRRQEDPDYAEMLDDLDERLSAALTRSG